MKMYKYEKKTLGLQKMILFVLEFFANIKSFGFLFLIKPSSGLLNM